MCRDDGLSERGRAGGVARVGRGDLGGYRVEGGGEEREGERVREGEVVEGVEGAEDVEGLEGGEERDGEGGGGVLDGHFLLLGGGCEGVLGERRGGRVGKRIGWRVDLKVACEDGVYRFR